MESPNKIGYITFLLAAVAGFCDTATFVAGDAIFSAHVTGNFIVFAAQTLFGTDPNAWIKLLTFPVFVIAVIAGGWLIEKTNRQYLILQLQSLLLITAGIAALFFAKYPLTSPKFSTYFIVLSVVFAMGLQNAFGKLLPREVYGPTTMMTGNVTQASLNLGNLLRKGLDNTVLKNLKIDATLVVGFLGGCFAGALLARQVGLSSVLLPGILMFGWCLKKKTVTTNQP